MSVSEQIAPARSDWGVRLLGAFAGLEIALIVLTRTAGSELNDGVAPEGQGAAFVIIVVLLVLVARGRFFARAILFGWSAALCTLVAGALANEPSWYLLSLTVVTAIQVGLMLNRAVAQLAPRR